MQEHIDAIRREAALLGVSLVELTDDQIVAGADRCARAVSLSGLSAAEFVAGMQALARAAQVKCT